MTISFIIPAFNEEAEIGAVLSGLKDAYPDCELIVVDDGSSDLTAKAAQSAGPDKIIRHHRNRGLGAAIKTGSREATGDFIVIADADGQHTREAISKVVACLRENEDMDCCLTERVNIYTSGFIRTMGKILINFIVKRLTGEKLHDNNCGLRAFRRKKIIPFFHLLPDGFSFSTTSTVLAYKEDFNIRWVKIRMEKRRSGTSQVKMKHGFDTLMLIFRLIVIFDPLNFFLPLAKYSFLFGILSMVVSMAISEDLGKNYIFFLLFGSLAFVLGLVSEQITNLRKEIGFLKIDDR